MTTVPGRMSGEDKERRRELLALVLSVADLRAGMLNQLAEGIDPLTNELAPRTGRPASARTATGPSGRWPGHRGRLHRRRVRARRRSRHQPADGLDEAIGSLSEGMDR